MKVFIFLFLIVFTYQDDYERCSSAESTQCKSISISINNMECCQVISKFQSAYIPDNFICSVYPTTKMTQEIIEQIEGIYRETHGLTCTMNGACHSISFKNTMDCPSQKFTINYDASTFTDEEKEILKKENNCFRLYYEGLYDLGLIQSLNFNLQYKEITKEDCFNAVMLPSSKNFATCAFASYDFQLADGSTKNVNTCLFIPKSTFDTKTLDQNSQQSFSSYSDINGVTITSYKIEINDKNGKSLTYDSKTKSSTTTSTSEGKGGFIEISKLLALIFIIYLL